MSHHRSVAYELRDGHWTARLVDVDVPVEAGGSSLLEAQQCMYAELRHRFEAGGALSQLQDQAALQAVYIERLSLLTGRRGNSEEDFLLGLKARGPLPDLTSPYRHPDDSPWPRASVICVLDELGAHERIAGEPDIGELLRRRDHLHRFRELLADPAYRDEETLLAYTDNVLLAVPFSERQLTQDQVEALGDAIRLATEAGDHNEAAELSVDRQNLILTLIRVVTAAAYYQLGLALNGQLIRGGIDIGTAYIDDTQVLGPPILKAHELEAKEAVVPRVLLSRAASAYAQVISLAEQNVSESVFANCLAADGDGHTFVNYLDFAEELTEGTAETRVQILENHATQIEAGLRSNAGWSRVFEKWRWVAEYHNWFVDRGQQGRPIDVNMWAGGGTVLPRSFHPFDLRQWSGG